MEPTRRGQAIKPIAAIALLLVAVACFGLWRVLAGSTNLPYRTDATPPATAHVTQDHTYSLAVPGGVQAMLHRGVPPAGTSDGQTIGLQCTYTANGVPNQTLAVSAESTTTKATNTVGEFTAPVTGDIAVTCAGWGAMFVPDSDDRPYDSSGLALWLGTIALTVGVGLGLGAWYSSWQQRRAMSDRDSDHDQVEALVDVPRGAVDDGEVLDHHTRDVVE